VAAEPLEQLIERARGSIVHISERDGGDDEVGNGSGFVITDDGKLATNQHVIAGARRLVAVFHGGREVEIEGVWAVDEQADLAILQLSRGTYRSLTLSTTLPKQGASVVMIGSPMGLSGTVSTGIVSAVREEGLHRREIGADLASWGLQITAPMSPGSSGSAVLGDKAEVIGVAVGQRTRGQSLNFAVPVSFLRDLRATADQAELKALDIAAQPRTVLHNLMISAGLVLTAVLAWWYLSRRLKKKSKRSLERFGL
jgi:serine protease Do